MKNSWDSATGMTEVKEDRLYTKDHEWAKLNEDKTYTVGISSFAVDQLGDITMLNFELSEGEEVEAGEVFGTIESVKTLSDLFAPISGKILKINRTLEDKPELVNESTWDDGWLIIIEPNFEQSHLIGAEEYKKLI